MKSLNQLMNLKGRVALMTGGSGHIGAAMSEALAELGANIVTLDLDRERCEAVSRRIETTYGVRALALAMDLAEESKVRAVPDQVLSQFGRLDILVNCAALVNSSGAKGWTTPFLEQSSGLWRAALEINLTAPFVLTQVCAEALAASGHGSVINISSIYGVVGPDMRLYEGTGMGNAAAYAASKAGLIQLTRWLASVLAPKVRVNSITPGGLWRGQPETFHQRYIERTPLKRMGCEEDFKGACVYLASELSAYVTGHNLVVDGGFTTW